MAGRIGTRPITEPLSARQLVDKYSGVGLQFKVKFVGSENVNRKRGDAEAAKYCIPTLKTASQQSRVHKPRAALGLSLKGISLYDETTKSITRVPLEKVTYVSHDPVDVCYIGVIISDKDSHTGFKLYCFKAEKPVAINIVNSSRELFELMYKLRQAKKKLKEEKEKTEKDEANADPDHSNLPPENAPPPSYTAISGPSGPQQPKQQQPQQQPSQQQNPVGAAGPPERPPPPRPVQPPPLPPRPEDENELFSFSLDPPPSNATSTSTTTNTTNAPADPLFSGFEDLQLNEPMVSIAQQTPTVPPPQTGGNPFAQPQSQPFMQQQPQQNFGMPVEPSITMDLMDAIKNPVAGTTSYNYGNPMGMGGAGMGMSGAGMGMGGGTGMGMMGGNMGMGAGNQFGGNMGMGAGNQFGGNPGFGFGQFGNQGQAPQTDILSMPADPIMNTGFSQPLLPTSTAPQQNANKPQQFDAFSGLEDLVSMAKTKVVKSNSPPPPRYSTIYSGPTETTDSSVKPPTLQALSEVPRVQSSQPQAQQSQPLTAGGGGFDDFWSNDFGNSSGTNTSSATPSQPPTQNAWVSF